MNPSNFTERAWGRPVRAPEGYWAFVPAPLPPKLEWTPDLVRTLSEADQAVDGMKRANRLLALSSEYHQRVQEARASALLLKLIDGLFVYPAITAPGATQLLEVTPRSAQANINKLVAGGILKEVTGQRRNRVYVAERIIQVIEEPETNG